MKVNKVPLKPSIVWTFLVYYRLQVKHSAPSSLSRSRTPLFELPDSMRYGPSYICLQVLPSRFQFSWIKKVLRTDELNSQEKREKSVENWKTQHIIVLDNISNKATENIDATRLKPHPYSRACSLVRYGFSQKLQLIGKESFIVDEIFEWDLPADLAGV